MGADRPTRPDLSKLPALRSRLAKLHAELWMVRRARVVDLARYRETRASYAACVQAVMRYREVLDQEDGTRTVGLPKR